jgi:RHS repeat-associated protein
VVTPYQYTGQRWEDAIGLYFYNARWYDPALGRFIQPDTIVPEPGNPQALNRYSYVLNNPVKYNDPTGHAREIGGGPKRWILPRSAFDSLTVSATPEPPRATSIGVDYEGTWGDLWESQGKSSDNHCGPANVVMTIRYGGGLASLNDAIEALGPMDRLPNGATLPGGFARAFNRLSTEQELGWTARKLQWNTKSELINYLEKGPVTVVLAYGFSSAHYVTLVGADQYYVHYLDPWEVYKDVPSEKRVQKMSWKQFLADWQRKGWVVWNWFGEYMVVYDPNVPIPTDPEPVPLPAPAP